MMGRCFNVLIYNFLVWVFVFFFGLEKVVFLILFLRNQLCSFLTELTDIGLLPHILKFVTIIFFILFSINYYISIIYNNTIINFKFKFKFSNFHIIKSSNH